MMTKKQNRIFVFGFMNTIMSATMSCSALLVNVGFLTLPMYLKTFLQALIICNGCAIVFRVPWLGEKITMLIVKDPARPAFGHWSAAVNGTLNTFFMTTFMTLVNVGFRMEYFAAWVHGIHILELVSVVVSLVASPIAMKIVKKTW